MGEQEKLKGITEELEQTFAEMSGYQFKPSQKCRPLQSQIPQIPLEVSCKYLASFLQAGLETKMSGYFFHLGLTKSKLYTDFNFHYRQGNLPQHISKKQIFLLPLSKSCLNQCSFLLPCHDCCHHPSSYVEATNEFCPRLVNLKQLCQTQKEMLPKIYLSFSSAFDVGIYKNPPERSKVLLLKEPHSGELCTIRPNLLAPLGAIVIGPF